MKCYRTACNNDAHPLLVHSQNGHRYCPKCARKINESNPNLIPWPTEAQIKEHKMKNDNLPLDFTRAYLFVNNAHVSKDKPNGVFYNIYIPVLLTGKKKTINDEDHYEVKLDDTTHYVSFYNLLDENKQPFTGTMKVG